VQSLNNVSPAIRYVAYDKATGQILHVHSEFNVRDEKFVEIPLEELQKTFANEPSIVSRLSTNNPNNLDFIKIETATVSQPLGAAIETAGTTGHLGAVMVDPVQKKLVMKTRLTVSSDKRQLVGDGQETAKIEISAVDEQGKVLSDAAGTVKVTTTRGRLSSRGGIVTLAHGRAAIELTAANETVSSVRVEATSPEDKFVSGHVDLEFL
jgi:hypothetical protein